MTSHLINTAHKPKLCGYCDEDRLPGGGVQVTATRWCCRKCWTSEQMKMSRRIAGASWGKPKVPTQ